MILVWALSAALALPAFSVEVKAPSEFATVQMTPAIPAAPRALDYEVHPLLLGALSDPTSPVAKELTARAEELAARHASQPLTAAQAAAYLTPLSMGTAVERPVAAILSRVIAEPDSAATVFKVAPDLRDSKLPKLVGAAALPASPDQDDLGLEYLRSLSEAAKSEPYAKIVFDGYIPPNALYNVTMTAAGPDWTDGKLRTLGAGSFGMVQVHPYIAGAVIKTIFSPGAWGVEARRKMYEYAYKDEVTGRALAAAGAGPRVLSHTDELGSPVLIKERVFGDDLHQMILDNKYGAAEHQLLLDLLARLAKARLRLDDLREPNVIIGHTALDSTRRAYVVDGGNFLPIPEGVSDRALARGMYREPARWVSTDAQDRPGVKSRPLNHILEEAVVASGSADWWTRLKVSYRRWRGADQPAFEADQP